MDSSDYLVSASLLRRGQDSLGLVADLAARLERSLPNHVNVDRAGWANRKKVKSLVVNLEPDRFRIDVDRRGPIAWIDQVVRGICLRSEQVDMDDWLQRLAASLSREAAKSIETRLAIEDALR
jgi:hypothetical protein